MKKIAISARGRGLEAQVDPRFGKASYFLLVNPDTMDFEVVVRRPNLQAAAVVAGHRPLALLTGNCGPKAFHTLEAAGIPVFLGMTGSVQEAVQQFRAGNLIPARAPNAAGHWV